MLMYNGKRKWRKGLQNGTFANINFSYILVDIPSTILIQYILYIYKYPENDGTFVHDIPTREILLLNTYIKKHNYEKI